MKIKIFPQSNSIDFTNGLINADESSIYTLGKIHKNKFANGEINVVIDESVRNKSIVIVSQPNNYEDIFELLETIDAAKRSSAKEIIGIIPSLPHSRQERRDNGIRTTISSRLIADMLQVAGLDRLITMDVHTTAIEGFYKIPFDNLDPFDVFLEKIKSLNLQDPTIVSPDFGGMKRAKRYANSLGYNIAFISKERLKANEVESMTLIGLVDKSDVIIIDDIIDTANTLAMASDLLKRNGAYRIISLNTHGIFSNDAVSKLNGSNINEVYVTNTIKRDFYNEKIKTVNVYDVFDATLKRILFP